MGSKISLLADMVPDARRGPEEPYPTARNCGNTRASCLPTLAYFTQSLPIARHPRFEHSRNRASAWSAAGNGKGTDSVCTQETQGVDAGGRSGPDLQVGRVHIFRRRALIMVPRAFDHTPDVLGSRESVPITCRTMFVGDELRTRAQRTVNRKALFP